MSEKKKAKFIIQRKTLINFCCVFVAATLIFTGVRIWGYNFFNSNVFNGSTTKVDDEGNVIEEENLAVSLLKDMTPIALDEGSSFYEKFQSQKRVNVLCLGVNDNMTDTIMLASYDMENQRVDIISIPRDTYYYRGAGFNSYAHHKINAIYSAQGVVKLAEVVSEILYGMPIHYYAIAEYSDVKAIMGVIGGVEMEIPFHMKYDDPTSKPPLHIDIPEGTQIIDSSNVMEFLRFRKGNYGYSGYPGGDIQRQETQQAFVKKVMKECLKAGNLTAVAKVVLENVESDLTYGMAAKLALNAMKGLSADNIHSYTLPGYADMIQELSFWVPYESQIQDMLNEVYAEPVVETTTDAAITTSEAAVKQ